ncbi:hypothetical protein NDU88_003326 [Pleurodeles waltl]|uniref:Uncharacterized protein n=1 Tax=Pleurodeles waltl TaxID=8319 RepID=A0AAV7RG95_PLEWA|nr:hypothetical protein NDU88_003326 [Pleurodeles waltl]
MEKLRHKIQGMPQAEQGHVSQLASGDHEESAAPSMMQDTVNKILGAIEDTKLSLSQEIGKISSELSHLRTDHHKLVDRVEATETSLEELQPTLRALRTQVTCLSERVQVLERSVEDTEGRSRRNNMRIVGMPEGVEGTDAVAYLETWSNLQKVAWYGGAYAVDVGEENGCADAASGRKEYGCSSYMVMDDESLLQKNVGSEYADVSGSVNVNERGESGELRRTQRSHKTPVYLKDFER